MLPASLQGELPGSYGATTSPTNGSTGGVGTASALAEICRRAEAAGADSLWAVDHLYWPHPIAEPLTSLAVAAVATSTVTLGTCVLQLPLRKADAVAKQATALQLLSGGRFVLGVGVGSHQGEYDRAEVDFGRRGRLLDEGIAQLRAAWTDAGGGPSGGDDDRQYRQAPVSDPVPVWIGGASPAARRRAALTGDGWVPLFVTPEEYGPALDALRADTARAGRDPGAVEAAMVVFVRVGDEDAPALGAQWLSDLYRLPPKAFARHLVAGTPEACADTLHRYVEAGARHIVVMVAATGALAHFDALRCAFGAEEHRPLAATAGARA
jgi:alkanesulfonate monooxygenase SsuD/methylene tetrahydromethanopterin reductase-like flavin-dependent oxidoreductase (luciferase family)